MKKTPDEYITVDIDYPRPYFRLDDLSQEEGNSWQFTQKMSTELNRLGYKQEAKELQRILKTSIYDELFNKFSYYFDLSSPKQIVSEDEEYVYLKVKKTSFEESIVNFKQPTLFKINNLQTLKTLIDDGEDLSLKNCYGRHLGHYISNTETLAFLLEQNKIHQWFELYELDNFNGTLLHTQNSIDNFMLVLKHMHDELPDLSERYVTGTNTFGHSALQTLAVALFELKEKKQPKEFLEAVETFMPDLKIMAPQAYYLILEQFNSKEYAQYFKNDPKILLKTILEITLDKKETTLIKYIKI